MSLVLWISVFWGHILHIALTYVALLSFGFYLWKMNLIVSLPTCYFQPCNRRPSSLHIALVHTGASIFTRSLSPNIYPVVLQLTWFAIGLHCDFLFFWVYAIKLIWAYVCLYFFCCIHFKHVGCIFEIGHMVDYIGSLSDVIIVCTGYLHYGTTLWCF